MFKRRSKNDNYLTKSTLAYINDCEIMDVRTASKEYFSKVIIKAGELVGKSNLLVIQKYEPLSLIEFLVRRGWQYKINMINENNYQIYFTHPINNTNKKNSTWRI